MRIVDRWLVLAAFTTIMIAALPAPEAHAAAVVRVRGGQDLIGTRNRFGIGLQSGPVSGLSMKYFMTPVTALQIGIGGSPWGFGLNLEYLVHPFLLAQGPGLSLPFYVGGGIGLGQWDDYWGWGHHHGRAAAFNVHVPVGLAFEFRPVPIDIFMQLEPGVGFTPDYFGPSLGGTLGARIFF
jgi:hypothetical protein